MNRLVTTAIAATLLLVCSGVSAELRILTRPSKSEDFPYCGMISSGGKYQADCDHHKYPEACDIWQYIRGYFDGWRTHGDTEGLRLPRNATAYELAIAFQQWWSQLPIEEILDYNDGPTSACLRDAMMWKYD